MMTYWRVWNVFGTPLLFMTWLLKLNPVLLELENFNLLVLALMTFNLLQLMRKLLLTGSECNIQKQKRSSAT